MSRLPRIIVPNVPHHVTQRGNRRQKTFFSDCDYQFYLENLNRLCKERSVLINAYCLMPNHVHLILTPPDQKSLTDVVAELHWRYTRYINFKLGWRGNLWQGRYFSVALSDEHFDSCMRYVEENPLRSNLIERGDIYPWQSYETRFQDLGADFETIRKMTSTGRPIGNEAFVQHVINSTGFDPRRKQPGRKSKIKIGDLRNRD
jgi:putative transposase